MNSCSCDGLACSCILQIACSDWGWGARAELRVFVRPQMASESMILADSIGLKAAQPDKIKTIAYLLAQTVALHFYETCGCLFQLPPGTIT